MTLHLRTPKNHPGLIESPRGQRRFVNEEVLGMSPEEREGCYNFQTSLEESELGSIHRIGGYPDCVQGDPKLVAHLVSQGLYFGDQAVYKTAGKEGRSRSSVTT